MLDINFLCKNRDAAVSALKKRGAIIDAEKLCLQHAAIRGLQKEHDELRARQRADGRDARGGTREMKALKEDIKDKEKRLEEARRSLRGELLQLPNIPLDETPAGKDEHDNCIVRESKKRGDFSFPSRDYLSIAAKRGWIDIPRAAKVSGSRFGYIKGDLAFWEFALVRLAFDALAKEKFIPLIPPAMIKEEVMKGLGYIDSEETREEAYFIEKDRRYLVGTAEQAVVPMHAGETFRQDDLPRRYVAFSSCFRREAGSYGKDTKGILRAHQFDKVEMVSFVIPEKSREEHQYFLSLEERLMQKLDLPYRVVQICAGEMGPPAAAQYDIETWMPGQNTYRETHSTSNTTDFQARRLNIRYKPRGSNAKPQFVHILNGTAIAIGRMLIAIIENYQTEDGSVRLPEALKEYLE